MPFMHAENLETQHRGVEFFRQLETAAPAGTLAFFENATQFAQRHLEAIERFGRFPARNAALGRVSTPEERAYLAEHPSGF